MKRSIIAGIALTAGFALASPMLAWSADSQSQPETTQAAPAQPGTPAMGPGMMGGRDMMGGPGIMGRGMMGDHEGMGYMHGHRGMGAMGHHGWMGGMGHPHGWMRGTPAQRCEERLARRAGMIAYTITKLNLTAQQRPLWDKLNAIVQAGTEKEQQLCGGLKAGAQQGQQTILDRLDRREKFLDAQVQMLKEARPVLQQFYQALTPEQQTIINHPFRRG